MPHATGMNLIKRPRLIYTLLLTVWGIIAVWQFLEHQRVTNSLRTSLINRSRDIAGTLGLVIRSQRRFGGVVSQERMEVALKELAKSGELVSVALLNASGDVVVSAGAPLNLETSSTPQAGVRWEPHYVTVVNLVDLGAAAMPEGETEPPTIVLPRRPDDNDDDDLRDGPSRFRGRGEHRPDGPPPDGQELSGNERRSGDWDRDWERDRGRDRDRDRGRPPRRRPFGRPFWMDEGEYQALLEQRGLHGLIMALSTENFSRAQTQDSILRWIIIGLAGISALGMGLAWRNLSKSSELQIRLLRARELNAHLREMNLAAAGLAHETRNPLNIIRGLAQMISRQPEASSEVQHKSRDIIHETDRVTAQLNEFINYSRPREVKRGAVALDGIVGEVKRALTYDLDEKSISLHAPPTRLTVEADELLFRQVLFNLLMNAVQAAGPGGRIEVAARRTEAGDAILEIRDDGPGVAPEHRADLFKPYFTTHEKGTGLGLAVVQQIVLAHGWEIEFDSNEPRGAIFRLRHLKLMKSEPDHAA